MSASGAKIILALNPGSTSTKLAVFDDETERFRAEIVHDQAQLQAYPTVLDQLNMRLAAVTAALGQHAFDLCTLDGVVGRGGMIPGLGMGGYYVNDAMREVILSGTLISHAS